MSRRQSPTRGAGQGSGEAESVHQADRGNQERDPRSGGQGPGVGGVGWQGYTTNLTSQSSEFVIDAYHQLWPIEKSFRMSKHDLQDRPVYHRTRDSIEAHLTIVFAALAVSHWVEHQTGWSIKKFVRTARRYRTVTIQAGRQTLTADRRRTPTRPDDLAEALTKIGSAGAAASRCSWSWRVASCATATPSTPPSTTACPKG
jgi:hypothetical protein